MKTLVISDLHLTEKFDVKKFKFLVDLIMPFDLIVINGDFWDSDYISYSKFLQSRWKLLFPLLKEKHTIYIYGNHDPIQKISGATPPFCSMISSSYCITANSKKILITHGHLFYPKTSLVWAIAKINLKKFRFIKSFSKKREQILLFLIGKKYFSRNFLNSNRIHKLYRNKYLSTIDILITSHTHRPEFNLEEGFINTGMIGYGYAYYVKIQDDSEFDKSTNIELIETSY